MARLRRPFLEWLTNFGLPPSISIMQLVLAGVFDRFPDAEGVLRRDAPGLGAVLVGTRRFVVPAPYRLGARRCWAFKPRQCLPSDYVREHIYFSVQDERVAVELRQHVGVDRIMFATDFPHIECEWPNSRSFIDKIYADVPEDERERIGPAMP